MNFIILLLIISVCIIKPIELDNEVNMSKENIINDGCMVIQKAIDDLPSEGGIVNLSEGTYIVSRSIYLRSGVTLRGAGAKTILRKTSGSEANLLEDMPKGNSTAVVDHPERFQKGDRVGIIDKQQFGWNLTQATIMGIENNKLLLNRGVWADYRSNLGGIVVGLFPMITAGNCDQVVIENLTIEADPSKQPSSVQNFTLSAIHFNHVNKVTIRHVTIRGYPGDGISIQGGTSCQITENVAQNCLGYGYHAGGGLTKSLFEKNQAIGNGSDGFFFCANVQEVVVRNNLFKSNKGHGIGGLGEDGDTKNLIEANHCVSNGGAGIVALRGSGNQIVNNVCSTNSQQKPGEYPGILLLNTKNTIVHANQCIEDKENSTQSWGILETGDSDENRITNNKCQGGRLGGIQTVGPHTIVQDNQE